MSWKHFKTQCIKTKVHEKIKKALHTFSNNISKLFKKKMGGKIMTQCFDIPHILFSRIILDKNHELIFNKSTSF